MRIYTIERTTTIEAPIEKVWDFFSSPKNLNELTPPDLSFEILTDLDGITMYPGLIINYKIRPLLNIPLRWTTEITHCETHRYFVDEQRFGPYSFWHHQHHFKPKGNAIEMTDIVHYGLPLGPLGTLANSIYVQKRLEDIFDYRNRKVSEIFK
jgi:ligand-binding SRPBCC domain-containing protein